MNRRNFLSTLVGGIAVGAAERTFPFRVYSFAKPAALKVYSFKDLQGILECPEWTATGESLDSIAKLNGLARRWLVAAVTDGAITKIEIETDAQLRARIIKELEDL